ncbi:MAG: oligosaccharide flippase family protein [Ruminococcus sp.]|nr:oligosaccharide flippase family protein [Candidatus Apopatosoma intestinale]
MPDKKSEPRILSGVLVLTFSNILVKLLGLFFKIPLHAFLGDQGMGYFNIAYNIFVTLYMVSTAGLPIAISILVSRSRTLGRKREVRRIFYSALSVFLLLGVIGTSIMIFGAASLAEWMGSPNSYHCIMTVAPTLFFICISSAIRGYFQGHQNMVPTATSEVIEAIGKFAIGIALGKYAISKGYSLEIAAAYAIAGIGIGVAAGMIYLTAAKIIRGNDRGESSEIETTTCSSRKTILRQLISIAVPITISAVALNLTGIIDSFTIINRMSAYVTTEEAEAAYGNYSTLAVTLSHLPSALITPIASALTGFGVRRGIGTAGTRPIDHEYRHQICRDDLHSVRHGLIRSFQANIESSFQ